MFTVISLNINGYGERCGAWQQRRQLLAEILSAEQPDLVALQAVQQRSSREYSLDQAGQLAALLPELCHSLYFAGSSQHETGREGSALLTRQPLDEAHALRLSNNAPRSDPTPRIVLAGCIRRHERRINVCNCHFSWDEKEFERNTAEALPFLQSLPGSSVIVGDFNVPPDSPGLSAFTEQGYLDLWSTMGTSDPGFTFEAGAPSKRIDYVWARDDLRRSVRSISLVQPPRGQLFSDHLGLKAVFEW